MALVVRLRVTEFTERPTSYQQEQKSIRDISNMKTIRNIKKTLLAVVCSAATTAVMGDSDDILGSILPYGKSLKTTESVVNALNNGAIVNATVDLSKCVSQDAAATSKIKGGLRISSYRIEEDDSLWFEDSLFTVSTSSGRADPIMLLLRYLVNPEGAITVTSFIFSIPDYTLTSQLAFDCTMNQGVSFNAAF
jgi:hypothetical protein